MFFTNKDLKMLSIDYSPLVHLLDNYGFNSMYHLFSQVTRIWQVLWIHLYSRFEAQTLKYR